MEFPSGSSMCTPAEMGSRAEPGDWLRQVYEDLAWETVARLKRVKDVKQLAVQRFQESEHVQAVSLESVDLGTGRVTLSVVLDNQLFYGILAEMTGLEVEGDHHLMRLMQDLTVAKREYDKLSAALDHVRQTGYGIVIPSLEDITFEQPELIKQGRNFGIKLTASAPSIHMVQLLYN